LKAVAPAATARCDDYFAGDARRISTSFHRLSSISAVCRIVRGNLPRLCTDPPGFDRTAFHRDFDASVVGFSREHFR
jgi:hypothetical protein